MAWDRFAFPQMDHECLREEALCYHPGKMLDVGTSMPGFRFMLQDDKGEYPHTHPHFRRICIGVRPSMTHCTMDAHTRNTCHPDHAQTLRCI